MVSQSNYAEYLSELMNSIYAILKVACLLVSSSLKTVGIIFVDQSILAPGVTSRVVKKQGLCVRKKTEHCAISNGV